MTAASGATIHASAVKVGDRAVLIRGPSGAGKSRLAFDLILAGRAGLVAPAILVGDDRVHLDRCARELRVHPAEALAGRIEIRGLGIRCCEFVSEATVGLVVDLGAADAERLPPPEALAAEICGVKLPRIPVAPSYSPLRVVIAALTTTPGSPSVNPSGHCLKGIGNHITPTIATD
jgi:HPr kinase/phosphorylase